MNKITKKILTVLSSFVVVMASNSMAGSPQSWEMRDVITISTQLRLAALRLRQNIQQVDSTSKEALEINADFNRLYLASSKMESFAKLYRLQPQKTEAAFEQLQDSLELVENKWASAIDSRNASRNSYWSLSDWNFRLSWYYSN